MDRLLGSCGSLVFPAHPLGLAPSPMPPLEVSLACAPEAEAPHRPTWPCTASARYRPLVALPLWMTPPRSCDPSSCPQRPSTVRRSQAMCRSRRCDQSRITVTPSWGSCSRSRASTPSTRRCLWRAGTNRRDPVPSTWFFTTSTACSARALQACCILLPVLGFASLRSMLSTFRPKPVGRAPDVPETRFIPFEVFHPSTAAPRHRGRCPLDVPLPSRCAATEAVAPTPEGAAGPIPPHHTVGCPLLVSKRQPEGCRSTDLLRVQTGLHSPSGLSGPASRRTQDRRLLPARARRDA